jgi:formylmethanofuran dehydrogenase subunit E
MSIKTTDVFIEFECDECGNKDMTSIDDIIQGGNPLCQKCPSPIEMCADDKVLIPEMGD